MPDDVNLMEPDRYFYHYTSWHTASEHIIRDGQLRLSPYRLMHDPLEAQAPDVGEGSVLPACNDEALKQNSIDCAEATEAFRLRRQNSKLLSLSVDSPWASEIQDSDRRFGMGWARSPMWQHYANNHTGVCLLFERDALSTQVEEQLASRSAECIAGPSTTPEPVSPAMFASLLCWNQVCPAQSKAAVI